MTSRQRIAVTVGLLVLMFGLARALLPFDERVGLHVYQRVHCGMPAIESFRRAPSLDELGKDGLGFWQSGTSACREPSQRRVTAGLVLVVLASIGTVVAVRVLREPASAAA